jgi:hypothetical protein
MGRGLGGAGALGAVLLLGGCEVLFPVDLSGGSGGQDAAASGGAYRAAVLADGPTAYWRLAERTGRTAGDETGHGNDGTYSPSCALGAAGALLNDGDAAAAFDGVSSTVRVPSAQLDFAGSAAFSVEAWIKVTAFGPSYRHFLNHETQNGNRQGYAAFLDPDGAIGFERYVSAQGFTMLGPHATTGEWIYVVGTFDGAALTLYVNAALVATMADTRAAVALGDDLYLGAGETVKFFDGAIDEAAVYARALTPAQVAAHYHASGR